jgi:putative effector of murein hydrolase LrgA (UPF0299 family)
MWHQKDKALLLYIVFLFVPALFAVNSTRQSALGPRRGLWPVFLMCNP